MKLVDILARDWDVWPYKATVFVSQDSDRDACAFTNGDQVVNVSGNWNGDSYVGGSLRSLRELADDQRTAIVTFDQWEIAREMYDRPPAPANGTPLIIGTRVEWESDYGWLGGTVVGHDQTVTIVRHNDGYSGLHPHQIRPIRTPEQIAAEERERTIEDIREVARCAIAEGHPAAEAVYDAGYRKTDVQ